MGEFIFVVTLCMTNSTQLITETVRANTEAGAAGQAQRLHPGYLVCGTPKKIA
jgi:hypothetical protein